MTIRFTRHRTEVVSGYNFKPDRQREARWK
jgi:hypothetical protein